MDVGIGLFVPSLDGLPWLIRFQRNFTWGGASHPQEPIYYCVDQVPVFQLCSGDPPLAKFLPEEIGFDHTKWEQLIVANEGLRAFEDGTLDLPDVVERILSPQDHWAAFWLVHCDQWRLSGKRTPGVVAKTMREHLAKRDAADGFLFWAHERA